MQSAPTANTRIKSAKEVREEFERAGISIAEWAKARGFDRFTVYGVLTGRHKGTRGKTHQIAVALGLKDGPIVDAKDFKPLPMKEAA